MNIELKPDLPELSDRDFDFLRRLIYDRSRIHLSQVKKVMVASRLARRLRQLQLPDYHKYCQLLRTPAGEEELRHLIDSISTNHTHFFREMKHFDLLRETVLPQWRVTANAKHEMFRAWSAACSSGDEPFSLAIYLAEYLAPAGSNTWQIEASDISTRVLDLAHQGIYEPAHLTEVKPEWLHRYFQKITDDSKIRFYVKDKLRQRVRFHHLNLLQPPYPFTQLFHVIFCRNVMIYFDRSTQEDLMRNLVERLAPGGYLMVGHSESLTGIKHTLQHVHPSIYLKPAA